MVKKIKKTISKTQIFLKKQPVISLLLFFLLISNIAQFGYFYRENQLMKKELASIDAKATRFSDNLKETKEIVTELSKYFEEKGNVTIAALLETVNRLEQSEKELRGSIQVINANADIMDSNFAKSQEQFKALANAVEKIRETVIYLLSFR